jgi:hypothetical protein
MIPLALLLAASASSRPSSPPCLPNGTANAQLVGTIGIATARGAPGRGIPAYRYVTLTLDQPVCIVDHGRTVRLSRIELIGEPPNQVLPFRFKGRHASVGGRRLALTPDAPQPAALYAPSIAPVSD